MPLTPKARFPAPQLHFLSVLLFSWLNPIYQRVHSKTLLETSDLCELEEDNKAEHETVRLEGYWQEETGKSRKSSKRPSLCGAVWRCYRRGLLRSAFYATVESASRIAQAVLIGLVLTGLAETSTDGTHGDKVQFIYVPALCLATYLFVITLHRGQFLGKLYGMRLRVALTGLVYKKVFKLTQTSAAHFTTGHVINLVSNDVRKFDNFFRSFHHLWLAPLELVITTYLVWRLIGWLAIVASVYMLLFIPILGIIAKLLGSLQLNISSLTDRRVRLTSEILTGIRTIKMYTWELPLAQMIKSLRKIEMKTICWLSVFQALIILIYFLSMVVLTLILYTGLVIQGQQLTAQNVFTTMVLYSNIKHSLCGHFGLQISYTLQGLASLARIQNFLVHQEKWKPCVCDKVSEYFTSIDNSNEVRKPLLCDMEHSAKAENISGNTAIDNTGSPCIINIKNNSTEVKEKSAPFLRIEDVTCYWNNTCSKPCLSNINVSVSSGEILAVTGPVGSGKSSLLKTILGETNLANGRLLQHGRVVYAPQIPWIFTGTVRENILFGLAYDESRYKETVEACQLVTDFNMFPNGDSTLIGERGIILSGGQRARVSLARAVYYHADIYLLDDPFSALDIKVGKKLFELCIKGLLKSRVVILVTHHLSYLRDIDRIILLKDGSKIAEGNYEEIRKVGIDLSTVIQPNSTPQSETKTTLSRDDDRNLASNNEGIYKGLKRADEARPTGTVALHTYCRYFRTGNSIVTLMFVSIVFVATQVVLKCSEWWLARWTDLTYEEQQNHSNIYIFAGLIGSYVVLSVVTGMTHYQTHLNSNERLHDNVVKSVIRTPVLFFDTNPVGRIQNRISKDLGYVDGELPTVGFKFFFSSLNCLGSVLVVAVLQYWALLAAVPLFILFLFLATYYVRTSREVKRLEAASRSPVYSHVSETLHGLTTIQCLGAEDKLLKAFYGFQDEHTRAWFTYIAGGEWLGLRAELLTATFLAAASVAAVTTSADAGFTGLALYSAVNLTQIIYVAVHNSVQYETLMTSVERVLEYSELPPEAGYQVQAVPPPDWPQRGTISFEDVSLVYYKGGPKAVRNINIKVEAKQKVGIVGQTGAGKSSLLAALFRLPEMQGRIRIDGQDISTINLQCSRTAMSVIPQDPFLFSGELRTNLDPFNSMDDMSLWQALERVELKEKVQSLPGKLRYELKESGSNLSVGERQLVCLARALLKQNRIIVIDEATANVDFETDRKIQETIRQNFSECTVLTIAHRLDTIMDSDRVMVLSGGTVIECDSPQVLLERKESAFAQLISQM